MKDAKSSWLRQNSLFKCTGAATFTLRNASIVMLGEWAMLQSKSKCKWNSSLYSKFVFHFRYESNSDFRMKVGCLIGLGLVPKDFKRRYMQEVIDSFGGDPRFRRLVQEYFIPTWFGNLNRPVEMWDWFMVSSNLKDFSHLNNFVYFRLKLEPTMALRAGITQSATRWFALIWTFGDFW